MRQPNDSQRVARLTQTAGATGEQAAQAAGHLRLPDPVLGARQFLGLIATEMPDLTRLGTKFVDDDTVRTVAARGGDTFLAAYEAPPT